jgi:hypothetical protein
MKGEKVQKRKPHLPGTTTLTRAKRPDGTQMQFTLERKLQVPEDAPPRLLHDIETYSALIELQARMAGAMVWYQRLT